MVTLLPDGLRDSNKDQLQSSNKGCCHSHVHLLVVLMSSQADDGSDNEIQIRRYDAWTKFSKQTNNSRSSVRLLHHVHQMIRLRCKVSVLRYHRIILIPTGFPFSHTIFWLLTSCAAHPLIANQTIAQHCSFIQFFRHFKTKRHVSFPIGIFTYLLLHFETACQDRLLGEDSV